jgi:hypothetical protein
MQQGPSDRQKSAADRRRSDSVNRADHWAFNPHQRNFFELGSLLTLPSMMPSFETREKVDLHGLVHFLHTAAFFATIAVMVATISAHAGHRSTLGYTCSARQAALQAA